MIIYSQTVFEKEMLEDELFKLEEAGVPEGIEILTSPSDGRIRIFVDEGKGENPYLDNDIKHIETDALGHAVVIVVANDFSIALQRFASDLDKTVQNLRGKGPDIDL